MKDTFTIIILGLACFFVSIFAINAHKNSSDQQPVANVTENIVTTVVTAAQPTAIQPTTQAVVTTAATVQSTTASGVSVGNIESLIATQEVKIISTKYVVQDDQYKTLYPDLLQAVISNGGTHEIKNAVVAFVAWDKNNLPVKIKGDIDFSDGSYIKRVSYNDINLIPGATYGDKGGLGIDQSCDIKTFKAILVSYEAFDGYTWENPYYNDWCTAYEGVKYTGN